MAGTGARARRCERRKGKPISESAHERFRENYLQLARDHEKAVQHADTLKKRLDRFAARAAALGVSLTEEAKDFQRQADR